MSININIPEDSREWLFQSPRDRNGRLWSMGRFRPRVERGDDIFFRFDGVLVAAATVHEVYKPGLFNGPSHNGLRDLRGWKLTWLNQSFIDLRDRAIEFEFASNDNSGRDAGEFSFARLCPDPNDEGIGFEFGSMTVAILAGRRIRLGRRVFPTLGAGAARYVGNLGWNSISIDLLTAADVFNHLNASGFYVDNRPDAIEKRLKARKPIRWRDLLALRFDQEVA